MKDIFKDKAILITGGTGSFGHRIHFLKRLQVPFSISLPEIPAPF